MYDGLTFHVKSFPIVIHRLGLWRPLVDSLAANETVTVGLRNRRTNELLFHVTFTTEQQQQQLPRVAVTDGPEAGYAFQAVLWWIRIRKNPYRFWANPKRKKVRIWIHILL
jgi:hypothetical protein